MLSFSVYTCCLSPVKGPGIHDDELMMLHDYLLEPTKHSLTMYTIFTVSNLELIAILNNTCLTFGGVKV